MRSIEHKNVDDRSKRLYWLNFTINVIHYRRYFYAILNFKDNNFLL